MNYNNPNQINNIVELCDRHQIVEYLDKSSWKQGRLIGIRRFSGDYLFIIFDGHEKFAGNIRIPNEQLNPIKSVDRI